MKEKKTTSRAGWVKIRNEADLPSNRGKLYFTLRKTLNTPMYKGEYYEEHKQYWLDNYEYYKEVKMPLPPRLLTSGQ